MDDHGESSPAMRCREFTEYKLALRKLSRVAAHAAAGEGDAAEARRSLLDSIAEVVRARTKVWDLLSWRPLSGRLSLPLVATLRPGAVSRISPASQPVAAEDLAGIYVMNPYGEIAQGPLCILLADGTFHCDREHYSEVIDITRYAGRWRMIDSGVELSGYRYHFFRSDLMDRPARSGYSRFRAELRLVTDQPYLLGEVYGGSEPDELGRSDDEIWLFARERGPDWQSALPDNIKRGFIDSTARSAAELIQSGEAAFARREKAILKFAAKTPLEPATLTEAEMESVEKLMGAAESLSRDGLVEESLKLHATFLAQHPSHAIRYAFPARFWRRLRDGNEELLFLSSSFRFIRITARQGARRDADTGDWVQLGEQLQLLGIEQVTLTLPKPGAAPHGYDELSAEALPGFLETLVTLSKPLSPAEAVGRLEYAATKRGTRE